MSYFKRQAGRALRLLLTRTRGVPSGSERAAKDADSDELNFAWRVYELMAGALKRVDDKAWILLGLEAATAVLVFNLSGPGRPLADLGDVQLKAFWAGVVAFTLAAVLALAVVFPQLRSWGIKSEKLTVLYFGHVREGKYDTRKLTIALAQADRGRQIEMLASQIAVLSRMAWLKYRLLQAALLCWLAGLIALLFGVTWGS